MLRNLPVRGRRAAVVVVIRNLLDGEYGLGSGDVVIEGAVALDVEDLDLAVLLGHVESAVGAELQRRGLVQAGAREHRLDEADPGPVVR